MWSVRREKMAGNIAEVEIAVVAVIASRSPPELTHSTPPKFCNCELVATNH
jgi:hypothetical protein